MRRNWWARMGLLLMVIVLGAAACGGDDGGSSDGDDGSEESIGEDDWLDEVSQLCSEWVEEVEDVDGTDDDEVGALAESTQTFADEVEDLGSPEGIEDEADEFVGHLEDIAGYTEEIAEIVADGDTPDDDLIEEGADASVGLIEVAEDIDLDCDLSIIDERADDDLSDDFTSDFSDDFSDDGGFTSDALDPEIFITEFGTDANLDDLAFDCEAGDLAACDELYFSAPIDEAIASYEGYGATCGGRLTDEQPGECVSIGGG